MGPPKPDITPVECQKLLRRLELEAYCGIVTALRAQGELTPEKKDLLEKVQDFLSISTERHKAEVRRAVNDEILTHICEKLNDSNASLEWAIEGRRMVPLIPRLVPQTSYLQIANQAAMEALAQNRANQLAEEAKRNGKVVKADEIPSSSKSAKPSDTGLPTKLSELIVLPRGTVLPQKSVMDNPNPEELYQKKKDQATEKQSCKDLPHLSKLLGKTGLQISPTSNSSSGGTTTAQVSTGVPQTSVSSHHPMVSTTSSGMKGAVSTPHTAPAATPSYTHQHPLPLSNKYSPSSAGKTVQSKPHFLHTALTGSSDYVVSRYSSSYSGNPAGGVYPASRVVGEKEMHPPTLQSQPREAQKSSKSGHEKKSDSKSSKHRKHHSSKHVSVIQSTASGTSQSSVTTKTYSKAPSTGDSSKHSSSSKKDSHKEVTAGKVASPTSLNRISKGSPRTPNVTSSGSGSILKVTTVGSTPLPARITTVASGSSSTNFQMPASYQISSSHSAVISGSKMPPTNTPQSTPQSTPHSAPHSTPHIVKLTPKAVRRTVVQKSGGSQFIPGKPNVIVVQKSQRGSTIAQVPRPAGPGTMHPTSVSPIMNRPKIVMTTTASSLTSPHSGPTSVRFPSPKPTNKTQAQVIMSPGGRARQIIPSTVPSPVGTQNRNRMPAHQGGEPSAQRVPPTSPSMVIVRPKSPGVRLPPSTGMSPSHVKGQERLLGQLNVQEKMPTTNLPPGHGQYTKEPVRAVHSSQSPSLTETKKQEAVSQLSATTAARALLDMHCQPPPQSEPVKPSKPTELPKTSSVTMVTSSSNSASPSQSVTKTIKPAAPTKKDVPDKSSKSDKSVKGESPLVTIEDQGVVSARINLTPSDVSEFVDQFEEFLEREGLMTSEQSSSTPGRNPQGSVSSTGIPQAKEGVKKVTQEVALPSTVTKVSPPVVKIRSDISTVPGVNQTRIIPTLETLTTLSRKPTQISKYSKGNVNIGQSIKRSPTLAKDVGQDWSSVASKLQGDSNETQTPPSTEKKEGTKTGDTKIVMSGGHAPKSSDTNSPKSVLVDSQTVKSLSKDHTSTLISDPGVSKSTKTEVKLFKVVTKHTSEKTNLTDSNDPYKWEDSPPVDDPEPNMSELIRAIYQPKISLSKLKQQDEPKNTVAGESLVSAKPFPDKLASQTLPKPASVVMETSSSFDISHMNLEDFTSQRMEEDEARFQKEEREEEGRLNEKNIAEEGAQVEAQKVADDERDGDRETWLLGQESQQKEERSESETRPAGEESLNPEAQQASEKTDIPGGVGGGKKMPTSEKGIGDGGDYQAASGSEGSVSESSGSEMQQVRASKRKRKAPTPIDEETGPSSMPSWARAAWNLLQRVMRFRGANRAKGDINAASWFNRPVDPRESPEYFKIIKNPMDFSTIKRNLENGLYQGFTDFHQDMIMVRKNCLKFNPPGHKARRDCDEVYQFYQEEYNKTIDRWGKAQPNPKSPKRLRPDPSLK